MIAHAIGQGKSTCLCVFVLGFVCAIAAADSPICDVVSGEPGGPAILIDRETFSPMFLAVNNQFHRDEVLLEEIRQAAHAGIRLISFNLWLEWSQSPEEAAAVVRKFCDASPDTYFYVRVWVGPSGSWLKSHPHEQMRTFAGKTAPMVSPASTLWLEEASSQLARRVREIAKGPYGHRFIGMMPTYLNTGEWFYPDTNEYWDYSPAARDAFRAWLKDKYRRNKQLQDAWGDSSVTFKTAELPAPDAREAAALGPFRDPKTHRAAMDMAACQSETMARVLETLCRVVKEGTRNRALAGTFYGYTFELNHNGPRALAHSGHLALARLLESPYVDLVHAPYSYLERGLGEPGHFHLPLDSVPLHKKLAIIEEDSWTHLGVLTPENELAPGWDHRTQDMAETLSLVRRNFGNFMAHRAGFWWFDLLSDGRWNSEDFWAQAGLYRRIAAQLRDTPLFEPQVAFVVDEVSVMSMVNTTHPYLLESLGLWRTELARVGAPVGYYLQSDLEGVPDSVRLLIMATPYRLSEETEREVQKRIDRGVTVVWTFAPGIVGDDGVDPNRIEDVTGIGVVALDSTDPMRLETVSTEESWELPSTWALRFRVDDDGASPLARYLHTDAVAVAEREAGNGVVVYSAVPRLPVKLLQRLAARAGVHLYRPSGGMVAVAGDYLFVHSQHGGTETFCWPEPKGAVLRLAPRVSEISLRGGACWQDTVEPGTTVIYRLEAAKPNEDKSLDRFLRMGE